jgi:hypothetical protein
MISNFINVSVVCEGQTEVDFVKKKLNKEYFNYKSISLKPIAILDGNISVDRVVTFAKRAPHSIITTLVDFYGFKNKDDKTVDEIEEELRAKVDKEFFIPYLQMHETEALWFSDVASISSAKKANDEQKQSLREIILKYGNPEKINDGRETAPSKRLKKIFGDYEKLTDGNSIFDKISIDVMQVKCPRFAEWIKKIEETAEILKKRKRV